MTFIPSVKRSTGSLDRARRRRLLSLFCLTALLGCAPKVKHLNVHIGAGDFDKALAGVLGDERMERELAVLIIAESERSNVSPRTRTRIRW
jgi:hypothetical protein